MNVVKAYTIYDISKWQMELEEHKADKHNEANELISLPTLQRGFVWKPYQIEMLWDSILRAYASKVLRETHNELNEKIDDLVKAIFYRVNHIYEDCYAFINNDSGSEC